VGFEMVDSSTGLSTQDAVDIVCGTLQAKLLTKELSCGTSRCVQLDGDLLTPCDLQRKAGKASSKNWKASIRYKSQPLSKFLVSYRDGTGRRCCRFEFQDGSPSGGAPTSPQDERIDDNNSVTLSLTSGTPNELSSTSGASNELSSTSGTSNELSSVPYQSTEESGNNPSLPDFQPVAQPNFLWGNLDGSQFCSALDKAYQEVIHWRKNSFSVPRGRAGKAFVCELARLFRAVGEGSALESVALKAIVVASVLLLQKPSRASKDRDHILLLEERMKLWTEGNLTDLVAEGRTIQSRLRHHPPKPSEAQIVRNFTKLMFEGKTRAALQLVSGHHRGGVLNLSDVVDPASNCCVRDVLRAKHPSAQPLYHNCLLPDWADPPSPHPVIFSSLNAAIIRSAALRTSGAAGPSGIDAHGWRRLCTSFHSASSELCVAMSSFARRLCTAFLSPQLLSPFVMCRLIALDKNPGVRPIGVCEVMRRIVAKAVLFILRDDIQEAAGARQLCAGQLSGVEAAVHAVRKVFEDENTEAVLLVDASNAFNSLNRVVALHNIRQVCPPLATILINTYRSPASLLVSGEIILSEEGTTQGDPLAMPMYALATIPLMDQLPQVIAQVWYADDACACGSIRDLHLWWNQLCTVGPSYGYFVNASKTWLVCKEDCHFDATTIFSGTDVNVTTAGRPYLGAAIGSTTYIQEFVCDKVVAWSEEIIQLAKFAQVQPHAAYSAFTHGLSSHWLYACRTMPNISQLLQPLEDKIRLVLIPALTGCSSPSDIVRELFSLPPRYGGLGLFNPTSISVKEYSASCDITKPLSDFILGHDTTSLDVKAIQLSQKSSTRQSKSSQYSEQSTSLRANLEPSLQRALDLATAKGSSSWLTTRPLEEHGFALHKSAFHDAIALRYGWPPKRTPAFCACGTSFSVEHALSCPKGGLPSIRHNEIRDLTATLLTEVCSQVVVEPELQPVSQLDYAASANIQEGARLDVAMNGFWGGRSERSFVDVRVFNPLAVSNASSSLSSNFRKHENIKKRAYAQRVREVEHATFTPLVMSASGGLAHEASIFYKRLASMLASKWGDNYSSVMGWLRCCLSFSLLRSSIQCIRGARSAIGHAVKTPPVIDLVRAESQFSVD